MCIIPQEIKYLFKEMDYNLHYMASQLINHICGSLWRMSVWMCWNMMIWTGFRRPHFI